MKKKTLISFLASLGCLACLAGCGADTSGLEAAKDYIKELYKDAAVETAADYERAGKITIKGVEYTIEWSVNTNEISVTKNANGDYVIDIDEAAEADVNYVLTAVITDPNGNKETLTYNLTMPKFRELTHAEFVAAEDGKAVVVKGVISTIINTSTKHEIYMQDGNGGYYLYNLTAEHMTGLQVGQEIRVRGTRSTYYGVYQIKHETGKEVSIEVLNATPVEVQANDITTIYANASDVNATELTSLQSTLVKISGVTVLGQSTSDPTYYNFSLNDNVSYVRISSSACAFGTEDQNAFTATVEQYKGYSADVVGVVSIFSNKMYLIPLTKDAFSNFTLPERTDAETLDFEAGLMTGLAANLTDTVNLQTAGSVYSDVAIAWASNNETVAKVENGKLVITRPASGADDATATITATLTLGEATKTVTYNITVPAMPSTLPQAIATAPVVGTEYKFYLEQGNLDDKLLYLAGGADNGFLQTTADSEKAATVTVEDAGDGKFYLLSDGAYVTVSVKAYKDDGVTPKSYKLSEERKPENACKYYWDDTNKTLVAIVEDEKGTFNAFIGTYNSYETFSGSDISYIGGGNFIARLCTMVDPEDWVDIFAPVGGGDDNGLTGELTALVPVVDTPYVFGMTQANLENAIYYLAGGMDGYYMATTTEQTAAILTYLEETTGGYYFYTYDGETKLYINMVESNGHVNGAYETTASTVYTIDEEHKTLIANVNDEDYWFATRNDQTYKTMGPCKVSYNGFYGVFYGEHEEHTYTEVVTDPTCTEDGYTTKTCAACGDVKTEAGETATGHNYVEGECTKCQAADPNYEGHVCSFTPVVTEPTCTTKGFTTYTCTCGEGTYTDNEVPALGHKDENADYKCDNNCGTVMPPVQEGVAYKFYVNQVNIGTELYITGEVDGRYLSTTMVADDGADVYVEKVDGGYKFYILVDSAKQYINLYLNSNSKESVNFAAETTSVFTFDAALHIWKTSFNNDTYYLGTYSTYNTISASKASFINSSNNGVSQFPARFATADEAAAMMPTVEEKVAHELSKITVESSVTGAKEISLTNKVALYTDATIAWEITAGASIATLNGNKLSITNPTEETTVSVKVTVTVGSVSEDKVFNITVKHLSEDVQLTTVSVSIADYATANSWEDATKYATITMNDDITVTATGGSNTGKYYIKGNNWRIYQNDSPSVTIKAAEGKTIVSVKITYASEKNGKLTLNSVVVASGEVVSVNANSITFSVGNGTDNKGQARITSIEVVYA